VPVPNRPGSSRANCAKLLADSVRMRPGLRCCRWGCLLSGRPSTLRWLPGRWPCAPSSETVKTFFNLVLRRVHLTNRITAAAADPRSSSSGAERDPRPYCLDSLPKNLAANTAGNVVDRRILGQIIGLQHEVLRPPPGQPNCTRRSFQPFQLALSLMDLIGQLDNLVKVLVAFGPGNREFRLAAPRTSLVKFG